MRNIFLFIWKNYSFFLFVLLMVLSFALIIQHNNYQRASFINKTNDIFGSITHRVSNIYEYFSLKEVNKKLAQENARLHEKQSGAFLVTDRKTFVVDDTLYTQRYKYRNAKVINNSINKRKNYITLNKGLRHGLQKDMGVISSDGVVGIVTGVSSRFATVMSVLNIDSKISAKIKNNNHLGSLVWEGTHYRMAYLTDIPLHVEFNKGDTIVTSGFSAYFPEGVLIGVIKEDPQPTTETFHKIPVKLSVDFNRLDYVYVIENLYKEEQELVEKQNNKE